MRHPIAAPTSTVHNGPTKRDPKGPVRRLPGPPKRPKKEPDQPKPPLEAPTREPVHPHRDPERPTIPKGPVVPDRSPERRRPPEPTKALLIEAAAKVIDESARPVVLVGGRDTSPLVSRHVTALARGGDIPVVATLRAKGVISDRLPQSLFAIPDRRSDFAHELFREVDTVITVGLDSRRLPVRAWRQRHHRVIHVGSASRIDDLPGRPPVVSLRGDIASNLESLRVCVYRAPDPWYSRFRERAVAKADGVRVPKKAPFSPSEALYVARSILPDDATFAADVTSTTEDAVRAFPTYGVGGCIAGGDNRRSAIATATIASLSRPGRAVLAAVSDDSDTSHDQEIGVAEAAGASFPVLALSKSENGSEARLSAVKRGLRAVRVESSDHLRSTLRESLSRRGLTVIEVPISS